MLRRIGADLGALPLEILAEDRVLAAFTDWADTIEEYSGPREADNRMSVLSAMLTWAAASRDVPEVRHNPIRGFTRRYASDRSDVVYSDEEIETLMERADPLVATAILIASETALRVGNTLGLKWSDYQDGILSVQISKQRAGRPAKIYRIPCTRRLMKHLDNLPRRGETIVTSPKGLKWNRPNFSEKFRETLRGVGIEGRHFHDLRGTAITRFAELGLTAEQISAITGHSLKTVTEIIDKYMKRTEKMAMAVIRAVDVSRGDVGDVQAAG